MSEEKDLSVNAVCSLFIHDIKLIGSLCFKLLAHSRLNQGGLATMLDYCTGFLDKKMKFCSTLATVTFTCYPGNKQCFCC